MKNDNSKRVTVMIQEDLHERLVVISKMLGLGIREATDEAIRQWNSKNEGRAQKKAAEILNPA